MVSAYQSLEVIPLSFIHTLTNWNSIGHFTAASGFLLVLRHAYCIMASSNKFCGSQILDLLNIYISFSYVSISIIIVTIV